MSFGDLVADHKSQLLTLLNQFRNPKRSYPSRPMSLSLRVMATTIISRG